MILNEFTVHILYMCKQAAGKVQGKAKMVKTGREGEVQKAAEKSKRTSEDKKREDEQQKDAKKSKGASEDKKREDEQQKDGVSSKQLSKKGRKRKRKELQVA